MMFQHIIATLYGCPVVLFYILSGSITVPRNSFPFLCMSGLSLLSLILTGGFISFRKARSIKKLNNLQQQEIEHLKELLADRTNELATMRQALAADFHDETGNLLSVILHQANILKCKADNDLQPIVENILESTSQLFSSSKDFLWYLHNTSEDPTALFEHLTEFGQSFFNKFDISFSVSNNVQLPYSVTELAPARVISLMYIFKEAMNNVVKHSGAEEVQLLLGNSQGRIVYSLVDNGCWKVQGDNRKHHGLQNIRERSKKNGFDFTLSREKHCTRIEIAVPCLASTVVQTAKALTI